MKILIADDDALSRKTLERQALKLGYEVILAHDGREALTRWQQESPRIVLTDWMMPEVDGAELCRAIRQQEGDSYTFVIMITSRGESADLLTGFDAGVDDYLTKPARMDELTVRLRAGERTLSLQDKDQVIFALAKLAEARDSETGYHLERIQSYCRVLAEMLHKLSVFPEIDCRFIEALYATSPLHDVGKVGIPDRILLKPGRLDEAEFAIMRRHTTIGFQTLQSAYEKNPRALYLKMAAEISLAHHERWDGTGYPDQKKGEDIPLAARILALADVFDALISKRVYKPAFPYTEARRIILEGRGNHFDPRVVDAFCATEKVFLEIAERYRDA